jgi:hypothetical protein
MSIDGTARSHETDVLHAVDVAHQPPPETYRRRSAGRVIALLISFMAAAGGTALTIAGFADMTSGRGVAAGLVVGLAGYSALAALWQSGPNRDDAGSEPDGAGSARDEGRGRALGGWTSEALRCEPICIARVDPAAVGVRRWADSAHLVRTGVALERAIDTAFRAWMTSRGAEGVVVVAGDERESTARTAWSSVRDSFPSSTVLAVRPPPSNGNGALASQPLVLLGEFAHRAAELGDIVVWIDDADAHLGHGLTFEGLHKLHDSLPEALIVMTMPWDTLVQLPANDPELADWMWRATRYLRVREP